MMNVFAKMACGVALAMSCGAAQATTIDFGTSGQSSFSTYEQDGFTITNGPISVVTGYNSGLYGKGAAYALDDVMLEGSPYENVTDPFVYFQLTGDQSFVFNSFEGSSSFGDDVVVTGYRDGVEVYSFTYDLLSFLTDEGMVKDLYFDRFDGSDELVDRLTF